MTPIAQIINEYRNKGINDLAQLAETVHTEKLKSNANGHFSHDRYTKFGSNTNQEIITPFSGLSKDCIVWCVNHYLGLNRDVRVINAAKDAIEKYGTGCGTSAMSGGLNSLHIQIESTLKRLLNKEKIMLFPTGYTANLGVLSALAGNNDLILFDRECHASIIDGLKLSHKKHLSFKHNNVADLEDKLKNYRKLYDNVFVVAESAYSMSGDVCPIKEITNLKEKYNFFLYVDEAHTFGFYGEGGRGYCYENNVLDKVDFLMSTFSKATASIGGFVAMDEKYFTYLQYIARGYTFQACFSPADAGTILKCIEIMENEPEHAQKLHANNIYMRSQLIQKGFNLGNSKSPVIPIFIPDPENLNKISKELYDHGIFSISVVYPAVKLNEGRIRFVVCAHHSIEQIDKTVNLLESIYLKFHLH